MEGAALVDGTVRRRAIAIAGKQFAHRGFAYGMRQEFLRALLVVESPGQVDWAGIDAALARILSGDADAAPAFASAAQRVVYWTGALQRAGGQPVFDHGRVLGSQNGGARVTVAIPALDPALADSALVIVVDLLSELMEGRLGGEGERDARARAEAYVKTVSAKSLGGSNTPRFLKAAYDGNIPVFRIANGVYQFGHGSKARWLDSSFTDETPLISTNLARNKAATAELLRRAGLPVPDHARAATVDEAVRIAGTLDYPVVVKPLDRDGGVGVAAGLKDEAAVRKAFEAARAISSAVLVEKHVEGLDYRLVVLHGKLVWALERVPAGVTGDGVSTVGQLVARCNADPARADRRDAPLKPIVMDDEAADILAEGGMTADTVPEAGRWVRLRRAANVASGGMPVGVFDKVHPDNRALAERAAWTLRLDLAGVDLLIPDIAVSWRESGAAICEVNAQPTLGYTTSMHLYGDILEALLGGNGRIPIALILGAPQESKVPALVARMLSATGRRTGVASAREALIGDEALGGVPQHASAAAERLLLDRTVDAAVVSVSDMSALSTGMPFDRCMTVALAGTSFEGARDGGQALTAATRALVPLSEGGVVVNGDDPACLRLGSSVKGARLSLATVDATPTAPGENGNGMAVHLEGGGDDARLVIGGAAILLRDVAEGPRFPCSPAELVLAAATAASMGCSVDAIRRGLAGVVCTTG